MPMGDKKPWLHRARRIAFGLAAIAIVTALAWTLGGSESPSLEGPVAARVRDPIVTTAAPARSTGEPIKELAAPGALDIRNELEGIERILLIGAGPVPITVSRSDSPKVRAVISGDMTIDVQDATTGQVLVRQSQLRLLPDEKTTLLIRRDASGAVVLAAAP